MIQKDTSMTNGTTFRLKRIRRSSAAILSDIEACANRLDALKAELVDVQSDYPITDNVWHHTPSETPGVRWNGWR
jgi:hypothetical protein